jgi:hypothetical protein
VSVQSSLRRRGAISSRAWRLRIAHACNGVVNPAMTVDLIDVGFFVWKVTCAQQLGIDSLFAATVLYDDTT